MRKPPLMVWIAFGCGILQAAPSLFADSSSQTVAVTIVIPERATPNPLPTLIAPQASQESAPNTGLVTTTLRPGTPPTLLYTYTERN